MLINPSSLYGGAAVKLDSSDAVNFYLNQQAKEQAKADSLDKYFSTLTDKANAAGMRTAEQPAFYKAVQNYQDFYIKNRKELVNGRNPLLSAEAQKLAKLPFQIAEDSKSILNNTKQIGAMIGSNPENRQRLTAYTLGHEEDGTPTKDPMTGGPTGIAANDQAKYVVAADGSVQLNPLHTTISVNDVQYNPKAMSAKEMDETLSLTAQGMNFDKEDLTSVKDPSRKFGTTETIVQSYTPDSLKKVGNNAALMYEDPTVQYNWNKLHPYQKWVSDPTHQQEFEALNKQFNDLYGRNISNNKDLFQASAIAKNNVSKTAVKAGIDQDAQWEYRNKKEYGQRINIANMTKIPTQQVEEGNAFDDLADGDLLSGYKIRNGQILDQNNRPYSSPIGTKDVHLDAQNIPAQIAVILKANGLDPDRLYKGADVEVKNGKIQNMSNKYLNNITRTGMKVFQLNYNKEPAKGKQPVFSEKKAFD